MSEAPKTLDAQTFASTMGQAVWLMTLSKEYKDLPIRTIEERIAPTLLLRHFKLYSKGKQPIAFLTWASVSDAVKARLEAGDKVLQMEDWRSGPHIVVVDCISPFNPPETFIEKFLATADDVQKNAIAS